MLFNRITAESRSVFLMVSNWWVYFSQLMAEKNAFK